MDWLDSVLAKDQNSIGEVNNNGSEEEQIELVIVDDENILFTDFTELIKELRSIKKESQKLNPEEMTEYKKLMSNLLPPKSLESSRTKMAGKRRNKKVFVNKVLSHLY
ncbi:hypothetical protein MACJ_003871 [Theileria orientalis]|uniref:Uncharacterized protein n=1 Tax=Theileria orientalis TaxID=68886 RepID=A0A976SKR5_THEOR|nr:hypothetical protein MACJ_003871 [Theileria orientalis]